MTDKKTHDAGEENNFVNHGVTTYIRRIYYLKRMKVSNIYFHLALPLSNDPLIIITRTCKRQEDKNQ